MAQYIDSIARLRQTLPTNLHPVGVVLTGYYAKNDKPHISYLWDLEALDPDNGGTIIQVNGVAKGRWIANLPEQTNVRHFGAKGDGIQNDTPYFQAAINFLHVNQGGILHLPAGQFLLENSIVLYPRIRIAGSHPEVSTLLVGLESKLEACLKLDESINVAAGTLSISNLSFLDKREENKKSTAWAIELSGILNATVTHCSFRNLGGGAIKISKASNTTLENIYAFDCGTLFKNQKAERANFGIIHMDRETDFSNTLNLSNTYISNCSYATGVYIASHAVRINNCTIESCNTLLALGSIKHVSRNIIITGLYLENARSYGITMINVINANVQNMYYRDSNKSKIIKKSVRLDNCQNVHWENANLGDYGFEVLRSATNITFSSCLGKFPDSGTSGIDDSALVTNLDAQYGAHGVSNNWVPNSNDFDDWKGSAQVSLSQNPFDQTALSTLTKAIKSESIYKKIQGPFLANSPLVFSLYVKGACNLRMRVPTTLKGFADLAIQSFRDTGVWRRVYVSGTLNRRADYLMLYITPENYGIASGSCLIAKAQLEYGKLEPGPYIDTKNAVAASTVNAINGLYTVSGLIRGTAEYPPTSGQWNHGDKLENRFPLPGAPLGWVCVESGTPGVWVSYGKINA